MVQLPRVQLPPETQLPGSLPAACNHKVSSCAIKDTDRKSTNTGSKLRKDTQGSLSLGCAQLTQTIS